MYLKNVSLDLEDEKELEMHLGSQNKFWTLCVCGWRWQTVGSYSDAVLYAVVLCGSVLPVKQRCTSP